MILCAPSAAAGSDLRVVSFASLCPRQLAEVYTDKIKLTVSPDKRTPWVLRQATHDLVDEGERRRTLDRLPTPPAAA